MQGLLKLEVPAYQFARTDSADFTEIQPTEYRADGVITLMQDDPVMGIVVEAQLDRDDRKRFIWPVYAVNLRARINCPVCLIVATLDEGVARWAAKPIDLGSSNSFVPQVIGPGQIPKVTNEAEASADLEIAVLSAMAHGRKVDDDTAMQMGRVALSACSELDSDGTLGYLHVILESFDDSVRQELESMLDSHQYEYRSEFVRKYETKGQADLILKLLARRFGAIGGEDEARLRAASLEELDAVGERLLSAPTLQQALESLKQRGRER